MLFRSGKDKAVMVAHRRGGRWSAPQVASFSGHWFDQDPVVAPDGSYLLFDSDRPVHLGGQPLRENYFVGGVGGARTSGGWIARAITGGKRAGWAR